jgi:hypothetical protein
MSLIVALMAVVALKRLHFLCELLSSTVISSSHLVRGLTSCVAMFASSTWGEYGPTLGVNRIIYKLDNLEMNISRRAVKLASR